MPQTWRYGDPTGRRVADATSWLNRRSFGVRLTAALAASVWLIPFASSRAQLNVERLPTPNSGVRNRDAEHFVQSNTAHLFSILADRSLDQGQRAEAFHTALEAFVDLEPFADFVLGSYASAITPEQHARFLAALHAYSGRLSRWWVEGYGGETLQVTGSSADKPGDVVVYSELSGHHLPGPMLMAWRVRPLGAGWKAIDVQFNGAWLGVVRRNDFSSTLEKAHGDVDALIAEVNTLPRRSRATERQDAGQKSH